MSEQVTYRREDHGVEVLVIHENSGDWLIALEAVDEDVLLDLASLWQAVRGPAGANPGVEFVVAYYEDSAEVRGFVSEAHCRNWAESLLRRTRVVAA